MFILILLVGLIASGIAGGVSLIKASEINATVEEVNRYMSSIHIFEIQYDALPDDMALVLKNWTGSPDVPDGQIWPSPFSFE